MDGPILQICFVFFFVDIFESIIKDIDMIHIYFSWK